MKFCDIGHCTCFFDSLLKRDHSPCCKLHDLDYEQQKHSRKRCDKRFLGCLKRKTFLLLAYPMFLVVRGFGWYRWNKSKRKIDGRTKK